MNGLNENAGEAIKLRLRTDQYDGFKSYTVVRRTLCHELAHNVWGGHGKNRAKFKELNSELNREVLELERRVRDATHTLASDGNVYDPLPPDVEAQAHGCPGGIGTGSRGWRIS
ncbi:WLM domain-containing protein [Russula earlei]|uniref:WLM domain-containing protein n=1 Tax=Russula earlei TaxID=71964 RepID=A0ACC0TX73_9AGAM|nr:WLM domain-containing protein [Russula earlei]